MEMPNRNASASVFGWQFQINVAIYLMLKYFKDFEEIKIEGKNEDIEIFLNNNEKIYAQAKAKEYINSEDTSGYSSKLRKSLDSLSDVKSKDINKLIYISNLEPNPLNSRTNELTDKASTEMIKILERDFYDHQIILASVYKFDEIKRTVIEMKDNLFY